MKVRNFKSLSIFVFVFALAREKIFIKTYNIERRFFCTTGKYTVCRHMRTLFSPEILHAGRAVKGLMGEQISQ